MFPVNMSPHGSLAFGARSVSQSVSQLSFKLVKFVGLLLADFGSEFLSPKRIRYVEEPRGTWWAMTPPPKKKKKIII